MKREIIRTSVDKSVWSIQLKKLLAICCRYIIIYNIYWITYIVRILQDHSGSYSIPLRMIEVFADPKVTTDTNIRSGILEHLSKHGKL